MIGLVPSSRALEYLAMAEEAQPGNAMNAFVRFKVLSTLPASTSTGIFDYKLCVS